MTTQVLQVKLVSLFLIFCLFPVQLFAQGYQENDFQISNRKYKFTLRGAEFVSGAQNKQSLVKVKLIGEVNKPGVHIVPKNSTLSETLSYAGGPTKFADLKRIDIRGLNSYKKIDYKDFLENKVGDYKIKNHDLVYLHKERTFWNSQNITVAATILGAIVSGIAISDRL